MKKLLSLLLAGSMLFSLAACGDAENTDESENDVAQTEQNEKKDETLTQTVSLNDEEAIAATVERFCDAVNKQDVEAFGSELSVYFEEYAKEYEVNGQFKTLGDYYRFLVESLPGEWVSVDATGFYAKEVSVSEDSLYIGDVTPEMMKEIFDGFGLSFPSSKDMPVLQGLCAEARVEIVSTTDQGDGADTEMMLVKENNEWKILFWL